MKKVFFACFALAALLVSACQKASLTPSEPAELSIEFASPKPQQVFKQGELIYVYATATSEDAMHGYEVRFLDSASATILGADNEHAHNSPLNIYGDWLNEVPQAATVRVEVLVYRGHDGTPPDTQAVYVRCLP